MVINPYMRRVQVIIIHLKRTSSSYIYTTNGSIEVISVYIPMSNFLEEKEIVNTSTSIRQHYDSLYHKLTSIENNNENPLLR